MIRPDRKPGVKLVTDAPKRGSMLAIRITEADADALIAPQSSVAAIRAKKEASQRLQTAIRKARENKGRMNL